MMEQKIQYFDDGSFVVVKETKVPFAFPINEKEKKRIREHYEKVYGNRRQVANYKKIFTDASKAVKKLIRTILNQPIE